MIHYDARPACTDYGAIFMVDNLEVTPAAQAPLELRISLEPGQITIAWPTQAAGFLLQRTGELGATNWVNDLNPVTVVGADNQVTITPLAGTAFFRLYHPYGKPG